MGQYDVSSEFVPRRLSRRTLLQGGVLATASLIVPSAVGCGGQKASQERLVGTAGTGTPRYGGVLAFSTAEEAASLDLHQETSYSASHVTQPCYSTLLQYDPLDETKIIGDLATKWEASPDGLSYTFHLVEAAKFHDGSAVTAEDVRFSIDRIRKPPSGMTSPRQSNFDAVGSIETPNPFTVVFKLKQKSASFLGNIASPFHVIMPKKVVEEKGNMKNTIIGSGPFKLKEYTRGASIELVKNPEYFVKGRPYLDGIKRYLIPDTAAAIAAFKTRKILYVGVNEENADLLKKEYGDRIDMLETARMCTLDFITGPSGPLTDLRVRRAVSLALDRRGSMLQAFPGMGIGGYMSGVGQWGLPESELAKMPGFGGDVKANREEGKRLMAEAGYSNGFDLTINTRQAVNFIDGTVWAIDQLRAIGINAKMRALELAAYFDALNKHQYEANIGVICYALDDPDDTLGPYFLSGSGRNYSNFTNSKFDQLYNQQTQELDAKKRRQLVNEMERVLFEHLPTIRIYWQGVRDAQWSFVRNRKIGLSLNYARKHQDVWLAQQD